MKRFLRWLSDWLAGPEGEPPTEMEEYEWQKFSSWL